MNGGRIARAVLGLTLGASCCLAGAVRPPDGDGRGDGAIRRERSGRRLAPRGARPGKRSPASRKRPRRRAGLDRETARIVEEGLAYLACTQRPDGSWRDRVGRKVYTSYRGREAPHVGVTALAGIAFLSSGVVPGGGHQDRREPIAQQGGPRRAPGAAPIAAEWASARGCVSPPTQSSGAPSKAGLTAGGWRGWGSPP